MLDAATDTGGDASHDGDDGTTRFPGIYMTSFNNNEVVVFAPDATGSAAPVRTIAGANLTAGTVSSITLPPALETVGIAVVP